MKLVEIVITRTEEIRVPIVVPDHWNTYRIRCALTRDILNDIAEKMVDQGWGWECKNCIGCGRLSVEKVDMTPPPCDDAPVYAFPDEPAPPHPDQLPLLDAA